jgi:hypothetical protein
LLTVGSVERPATTSSECGGGNDRLDGALVTNTHKADKGDTVREL